MTQKWVSVSEACILLSISRSTLYRRINERGIESKREGKHTMCLIDVPDESQNETIDTLNNSLQVIEQLRSENEHLRQQVTQLQERLDEKDEDLRRKDDIDHRQDHIEDHTPDTEIELLREQIRRQDDEVEFLRDRLKEVEEQRSKEKERADTIILQQTRQLEQVQRLLEDHSAPWYRRMFKRRGKPELS